MVTTLQADETATRADLDRMARRYFDSRLKLIDGRSIDFEHDELAHQLELTLARIEALETQIAHNQFDSVVEGIADKLLAALGVARGDVEGTAARYADLSAARAERQQLRYLAHSLTNTSDFEPDDGRFQSSASKPHQISQAPTYQKSSPSLAEVTNQLLARKKALGRGASQIAEMARVFRWLEEVYGPDRPLVEISKAHMRQFRDGLERLDVRLRGQDIRFKARLTTEAEFQIKSATSQRYWRYIQALFDYARAEFDLETDPTDRLKIEPKAGERRDSPEAFSPNEVLSLLQSPLYAGHKKGAAGRSQPGDLKSRDGYFWSGLLGLFTGARAGELNQLQPRDFVFDTPIPFIRITTEDADGKHTKQLKNGASIRNIPIHPTLIKLGLQQYVAKLQKHYPKRRVLHEFDYGTAGRKSEGLTRFWARYLDRVGLKKPGRATHVFRHTFVATMRAAGVAEEDIQAVVGHRRNTVTASYGGAYPLARLMEAVAKVDYGFDLVDLLDHK